MDLKTMDKLEWEIEQTIVGVVTRLRLTKLPLLLSQKTMHLMAKAAVAVSEATADDRRPEDGEP